MVCLMGRLEQKFCYGLNMECECCFRRKSFKKAKSNLKNVKRACVLALSQLSVSKGLKNSLRICLHILLLFFVSVICTWLP